MAAFRFHHRRVRRWWLMGTTLMAATVFAVVFVAGSGAVSTVTACAANTLTGSNFEIDPGAGLGTNKSPFTGGANLTKDGASPCIDWANTFGSNADLFAKPNPVAMRDLGSGSGDDAYGKGTSENDANPAIGFGSIPPNKSDLLAFGSYKETTASAKFLDLFWARVNGPTGTTVMDFELNQNSCSGVYTDPLCAVNPASDPDPLNPGHPLAEVPVRKSGDRLISFIFSGSSTPTVCIFNWNGSSWDQPGVQISSNALNTLCGTGATQASGEALGSINFDAISQANSYGLGDLT